jgi:hypothetical protein
MDWDLFRHGFGALVTLVGAVLPFAALFMRRTDSDEEN